MPAAAAIAAVGALGAAGIGAYSSNKAAKAQAQQQTNALNTQQALFEQGLATEQPFIDVGKTAASTLSGLLTPGPNQTQILSQLPGFQFAQDWGQKAVQNIGSTLGFGGNTLASGAQYATGLAQQGFGQYAGLLQNLTNTGAGAANAVLGGAVNQGANIGQTFTNLGGAQAAGTLGVGNAVSGGLTGAANAGSNALAIPYIINALKQNQQGQQPAIPAGIYSGNTSPLGGYSSVYP